MCTYYGWELCAFRCLTLLKLGAHRQIMLSCIWLSIILNGRAKKNFCVRVIAEHYSSLCHMAQPYLKYQISLILSPYLAQRYLAQPRVLSVCACLCLIAQPFLDNIQS